MVDIHTNPATQSVKAGFVAIFRESTMSRGCLVLGLTMIVSGRDHDVIALVTPLACFFTGTKLAVPASPQSSWTRLPM